MEHVQHHLLWIQFFLNDGDVNKRGRGHCFDRSIIKVFLRCIEGPVKKKPLSLSLIRRTKNTREWRIYACSRLL